MPAELFRPAPLARRRAWLLPLSIAAHGVVLAAVFIAPIMADAELPEPAHATPLYVEVAPPPLPPAPKPPAPPTRAQTPTTTANPDAAPLNVPDVIVDHAPQTDFPAAETGIPSGATYGFPGVPVDTAGDYVPPKPEPAKPYKVGGTIRPPRKIKDIAPQYPVVAQQARIEGTVVLEAVIGTDGRVVETRVLQSVRFLDDAARAAVSQWRFSPTLLNGEPVAVVMNVTIDFRLH